ncbi:MAG: PAS domain S-box protein [Ignavibacteriae bacterium]|nr:PAS domain S-box protein [Ignavibacteriota bacterium]
MNRNFFLRLMELGHSVRTKLVVFALTLVILSFYFMRWYVPAQIEKRGINSSTRRIKTIAATIAHSYQNATEESVRALASDLSWFAGQNRDLDFVMIVEASGKVIGSYNATRAEAAAYARIDVIPQVSDDRQMIAQAAPILVKGEIVGRVYVGMSLQDLHREIAESEATIAWVSLGVGSAVALLALLFSTLITRPVQRIVVATQRIAKGDRQHRVRYESKDEFGLLAAAFNTMVDNLEHAYDELGHSEAQYRDLFENASDLVVGIDADGIIRFINTAWTSTLGYSGTDLAGRSIYELIKPEKLKCCSAMLTDVMSGKRLDRERITFIAKNGNEVIVEGSVTARVQDGKAVSTRGIFRDITDQVKSEQSLRESQERFRVLSEATFEGISLTENAIIIDTNVQFAKMLGYERTQLIGKPVFELIHPDDYELVSEQRKSNHLDPYEHRLVRSDGSVIYVEVRAQPFAYQGRSVRMSAMRDITARKRAEQALLFEKARFEQLFANAPIGIVLADVSEKIIQTNNAFSTMFGYSPSELIGRKINEIILPENFAAEGLSYTSRVLGGAPVHGEAVRRRKDGTLIDVELFGVPISVRGKSVGLFGIYVDVSERKKAESEVRLLAHTVASTKDCVSVTDLEDRIIFVNDAFVKTYGYSREEVLGKDVSVLRSPLTPPGQGEGILPATLAGGWYGEILNRRKDGSDFPAELWTSVVCNDEGEPVAMVGVARDVTERKRAEESLHKERILLRTLIDNLPDAVYVKDFEARKTVANKADVRNMGRQSESEVLGKTDFDMYPFEMAQGFFADDQAVILTGKPVLNREEYVVDPAGVIRWLLTCKVPLHDEQGQIVGLVGIGRDITEHKLTEEHRTRLLVELESANKELNDFAYIVSHDLKAPLRAIGSLADWLATDFGDKIGDDGKEMLNVLLGRTKRMHDLIEGVLNYSRVGRTTEERFDIDLAATVPDIVEMISPPANINVKIEGDLPVVNGEPTRIKQVFQNLLSNAIKFMDKPNGEIRVGCLRENGHWKFSVTDNGPGIDKKHFGKIFQIFQTLAARDQFESTGIGLTIVKKIVELHGGKVWVESEIGLGTSFFFTLPAN